MELLCSLVDLRSFVKPKFTFSFGAKSVSSLRSEINFAAVWGGLVEGHAESRSVEEEQLHPCRYWPGSIKCSSNSQCVLIHGMSREESNPQILRIVKNIGLILELKSIESIRPMRKFSSR